MPIHYALHENNLTTDPNDYAARIQLTDSADLDAILRRITERGSALGEPTLRAAFQEIADACEGLLLDGYRVNLGGLCELYPRISGVFHGITDHFDHARHRVDVGANPGSRVRSAVRDGAHVAKVESVKPSPAPLEYVDLGSGETNGHLTPGNIGTLNGHRLKFDPARNDEGIFLIPARNEDKEVHVAMVQKNKPGQLIFLIPADLKKGDYHLEVRARMFNGQELRTGRLDAPLAV